MKKHLKRLVAVITMTAMMFMFSGLADANATDESHSIIADYNAAMTATLDSIEANFTEERRATETASIMQASQIKKIIGQEEWFSGQYIDSDGRLHVIVTDVEVAEKEIVTAGTLTTATLEKVGSDAIKYSPEVFIEAGRHSMSELQAIVTVIDAKTPDYVYGFGINEKKNCVVVELIQCDTEYIQKFETEIVKSDAIEFLQSEGPAIPMTTVYAGTLVWPTSSSRATITTFAYKGSDFGFVTVGHTLGNTIKTSSSGSVLGTTSSANKIISSTADGSWTKLNSGHTGMDGVAKIGSSSTNYGYFDPGDFDPVQGASVSAYLGRSNTISSGTVEYVSYGYICAYSQVNSNWQDITCYDIRVSGVSTQGGDSGSPLLSIVSVGPVIWGSCRAGGTGYSYFCNIKNIISALSLTHAGG